MWIGIYFNTKYFDDIWPFINKNMLVLTALPDLSKKIGYAMGKLVVNLNDFKKEIDHLKSKNMIIKMEIID